jgi:mannose-6-phosphate isomerase-like protein (cupin superfamily)
VGLIRQDQSIADSPGPGVHRQTYASRQHGSGALTTRVVTFEPGARNVHWHKIEEAMLVIEGEGKAILGDQELDIKAGDTLLGPANVRHGFVNTGAVPLKLVVAFPGVDVETFPA